jgi:type I pantothenate kinase
MPDVESLAEQLRAYPRGEGGFIVGVTGGVAVGKSTLSAALKARIEAWPQAPKVELAGTDGFLRSNAALERAGLTARKGFPESYDADALREALTAVRRGPATFPGYSHLVYDVDAALARRLDRPDVLIIEGLGLSRATPVDVLIYVDGRERDLEAWFVTRFMEFWQAGLIDAASFYARFAHLDREAATRLAHAVWKAINLPNLRSHIRPLRALADIVVRKGRDHQIETIVVRDRPRDRPLGRRQ